MVKYLFPALLLFSLLDLPASIGVPHEDDMGHAIAQTHLHRGQDEERGFNKSLLPQEQGCFARRIQPLQEKFAKIDFCSMTCVAMSCCGIFAVTLGGLAIVEMIIA
jgi:hypothetical protein